MADVKNIRLGVSLPMLLAGSIALGAGTFSGILGVWQYITYGQPAPMWIKLGHAHMAWWGALMVIASLLLPALEVRPWFKKYAIAVSIVIPWIWTFGATYADKGLGIKAAAYLEGAMDFMLFIALAGIALTAAGVRLPLIWSGSSSPMKYEILSNIEVPRRIFLVPTLVSILGVVVGYILAIVFHLPEKPVTPAALVQLHNHVILISVSAVLALLTLRFMNISDSVFSKALRIGEIGIVLTTLGLFVFVFAGTPSVVWIVPAGIYYLLPIMAFATAVGLLPRKGQPLVPTAHSAFRASIAFVWGMILFLVAIGAVIGLVWSTNPYVTVTYKQLEGMPYPGPIPEKYIGTGPVPGGPRGLENAHLSPGSWSHVAVAWLLALALLSPVFLKLKRLGLFYLFLITIPLAPFFNLEGRLLAWLGTMMPPKAPGGIGAMYYAAHPLKGFNIVSIFILALVLIWLIRNEKLKLEITS